MPTGGSGGVDAGRPRGASSRAMRPVVARASPVGSGGGPALTTATGTGTGPVAPGPLVGIGGTETVMVGRAVGARGIGGGGGIGWVCPLGGADGIGGMG